MYLIMQQENPEDYVISTGVTHSIRDLLDVAFKQIDIYNWEQYIVIDPQFYRPAEVEYLLGIPDKAKQQLEWEPQVTFEQLVKTMVEHDINESQKLE